MDGEYAEPYAGGASVALALLMGEYASIAHINDLDRSVFSFWYAVLHEPDELCGLISQRPISVPEWRRQRAVQNEAMTADSLELAFSTFYLNRTNRSGIIASGGVIGGTGQNGEWGIGARYNKRDLIRRIERIARYTDRIVLTQLDAHVFLKNVASKLPQRSLTYLDPPYFVKGQRLYANYYRPQDHASIATLLRSVRQPWMVSYDNAPEIAALYRNFRTKVYGLRYSAAHHYQGQEIMVFSPNLSIPRANPSDVTSEHLLTVAA